jgi:predicted ATP-grasp superfamily ATP-dependent carboligase
MAPSRVSVLHDVRHAMPRIPGCDVHAIESAGQEKATLARLAAEADWTVLVAPEFSGFLESRAQAVDAAGGRLLGPGTGLIRLASNKHLTAMHLARAGVPVAPGRLLETGDALPHDFHYPAVLKPVDGAGSQGVRFIERPGAHPGVVPSPHRLERFCPGLAASVAVLCGPRQRLPLAPCRQRLSDDGRFSYLGGSLPLDARLAARARHLAALAASALPDPLGYLGVDLVLGPDDAAGDDVVIEINPRLTTSYVGLRESASVNLAAAMLDIVAGREAALSFSSRPVQFDADGTLRGKTAIP